MNQKSFRILAMWLAIVPAGIGLPQARAQTPEPAPVVTQHRITIAGKALNYTAEVGRIAIRDVQTGEPHGYMFYTAYRVATPGRKRPVMFWWGGGPGGASAVMDFGYFGPMRMNKPGAAGDRLIESQETLLSEADLVFVDEISTGYSRATRPEYVKEFEGTIGDTNSFAEFIRCWRIQNDAEDNSVYVGGGSWGAPRAATVGYALLNRGIPVKGMVLLSGETSLNNQYIAPELFEALRVVGMTEVAFHYKKLAPELGNDFVKIAAEADSWARSIYAPALKRRPNLTAEERERVAEGLAKYTGLPLVVIDRRTLEILPKQFRATLLRTEGKTIYDFDMRETEIPTRSAYAPLAVAYMKYQLGYRTDLPYLDSPADLKMGFAPLGNYPPAAGSNWEFATSPVPREEAEALMQKALERSAGPPVIGKPLPATEEAIMLNPAMKVLIVIARWDGESTCYSNAELEKNLPPQLKEAMVFRCYDSGHSIARSPGILRQAKEDIAAIIRDAR